MSNPFKIANDASKLSIPQLQQALQSGTVPPFIGIPLLQDMVKKSKQSQAMAGGQQKPPTVAEQVMAQAQQVGAGVPSLETNLAPASYAAGGIIAFADGGEAEDDGVPTFSLPDEATEDAEDAEDAAMYSGLGRLPTRQMEGYAQTFEQGIGSLPAAEKAAEPKKEGVAGFIERIMHKESRGQRYGKNGELLTSEKGALGEMQVMPGTIRDPGFGIKPARGDNPDDIARVGREYAQVMLDRYGDPKLAAIAYNWGPGNTDKWLAAGADPSKLPKETQGYVKGFAQGGAIRFQNRGIVEGLPEEDYTTIPGLEASRRYEEEMRKAKGIKDTSPRKQGQLLPGFTERMTTPEPMGVDGLLPSTKYADAMRAAKGLPTPPTNKLTFGETLRGMFTPEAPEGEVAPVAETTPRGPSQTKLPVGYKVNGPSADANTMKQIDIVGRQLDEARADFAKMTPPGQRQLQADPTVGERYNAARDRMNALQRGYENLMESTGMNQAAFGVYRGALGTKTSPANPMVQAMGAQQPANTPQYPGAPEKTVVAPTTPAAPAKPATTAKPRSYDLASEADDQSFGTIARNPFVETTTGAAATKPEAAGTTAAAPESKMEQLLTKREANLEKQRSIDNYMALLSGALGVAGGTSPNAFANISAGAQQGIGTLMQSNRLRAAEENAILSGRLGQERYKNSNALQEARLAESKLNRERLTRADLADNLRSHEQQAERMAIQQIGQDKLGALDPAAQAAAIARKKAEILNNSPVFQTQMKEYMGSGYTTPQAAASGGASYSYDPKNRKLSGI